MTKSITTILFKGFVSKKERYCDRKASSADLLDAARHRKEKIFKRMF